MATELQRTVVIEMPSAMYDYLGPLADANEMTLSEMLIASTLATCLTSATYAGLEREAYTLVKLWDKWGYFPKGGLQAVILS